MIYGCSTNVVNALINAHERIGLENKKRSEEKPTVNLILFIYHG